MNIVSCLKGLGLESRDLATILAALIAALVAVGGWFAVSWLTTRREDRTRRLALTIQQAEKQISEFYAPLLFLLLRLDTIYRTKMKIENGKPNSVPKLDEVGYKEYFLPTHNEIAELLKNKIYLLEGSTVPASLLAYVSHFTSENLAWRLAAENIHVWERVEGFPSEFFDELQKDRALVYERYESALRELRHGVFGAHRFRRGRGVAI
jgi:hypothetical protein